MSNVLLDMIEAQVAQTPDAPALLEVARRPASYRDLTSQTRRHIVFLAGHGGKRPMRVATLLPAGADTGVFILACCCAATAMPINPVLSDTEIVALAGDGVATHLAVDRESCNRGRRIAEALSIPLIILTSDPDGVTGTAVAVVEGGEAEVNADGPPVVAREPDETALVLFTSGSTDRSKRVPLSLANLVAGSRNVAGSLDLTAADRVLSMMPMVHVGGLVDMFTAVMSVGGSVAFATPVSADSFFAGLLSFRPTWFQAVPAVLAEILRRNASAMELEAMRRLRFIRAVAQPLLDGQHLAFEQRFGVPLLPMYGMTEATGVIASPKPGSRIRPGTVGPPYGTDLVIADAYGNPVAPGTIGEVLIAGPAVTAGYEGQNRTGSFLGRWLRTGDQGILDADGVLTLAGRLKELINRGGEKISPLEIERAATLHDAVAEVAAFALPHPSLGEEVAIAVVLKPGRTIDLPDLQTVLRNELAEYKLPRSLLLLDSLPRVPNGKLDRRALPALAARGTGKPETKTPPATETEKALAALWAQVLETDIPFCEDDFFEVGGDSLTATNLAMLVERRFRGFAATGDLFLMPTLREMARQIDMGLSGPGAGKLRPDIEDALRKAMVSWRGSRQAGSVTVTRNALGGKTPFFWICQSRWQFEPLSEHLSPDRPLHVLSSLSNTRLKNEANTLVLARYYAEWIISQVTNGPIHLGGFCQGGIVAFHVAQMLDAMGRRPDILVLQDRFMPQDYRGPIALFSSKRGFFSLIDRFPNPQAGWEKYCHGPVSLHVVDAHHDELHKERYVGSFAAGLEAVLDAVAEGRDMPELLQLTPRARMDPSLRAAIVEARLPRFMKSGSVQRLTLRIRNLSDVVLSPTEESGISIAAAWHALDPQERFEFGGRAVLESAIKPRGQAQIELSLRMPVRGLPLWLSIDLVEDGISRFGKYRPTPARGLVFPLPAL